MSARKQNFANNIATVAALQELRRTHIELLDMDAAVRTGSADYLLPAIQCVATKTREHFGFDTWLGLSVVDDYGRLPDQLVMHYCPANELSAESADAFRTACEGVLEFEQVWAWPMFAQSDIDSARAEQHARWLATWVDAQTIRI